MIWDPTFSVGDAIMTVLATGVIPLMTWLARILIRLNESMTRIDHTIGATAPERRGILGDLAYHQEAIEDIKTETRRHRDWLIEMNTALPPDQRVRVNRS